MKIYYIKKILKIIVIAVAVAIPHIAAAQNSAFEGKHFYVGFMDNEIANHSLLQLKLFIVSDENASVSVRMYNEIPRNYDINPKEVLVVDIPDYFEVKQSEITFRSGIEVISDVPITVYCFNSLKQTSDAYAAIPVDRWGTKHIVMSMPNDVYDIPYQVSPADSAFLKSPRVSEFMVLGAYDNTEIRFTPKAITAGAKQTFREYAVTLHKGEVYLVKALNSPKYTGDLTGTIVSSDKPVGFISGHVRCAVPQTLATPYDSKDHLAEMLTPVENWGRKFVSIPFNIIEDGGDYYKITASEQNTVVTVETADTTFQLTLSLPGDAADVLHLNQPAIWRASRPVQIAQFMAHTGSAVDTVEFDPCMIMLPPVEQTINRCRFLTPGYHDSTATQFPAHYVGIVANSAAVGSIKIDNKSIVSISNLAQNRILDTDLYWTVLPIQWGTHEITTSQGGFTSWIFGRGDADSYGAIIGSALADPFEEDTIPPEITVVEDCGKISGKVEEIVDPQSSGIDFVEVVESETYNYKWEIDSIGNQKSVVNFSAEPVDMFANGMIVIEYRDRNGNGGRYRYQYTGYQFKVPLDWELVFKKTPMDGEDCIDFFIRNIGSKDALLRSISAKGDLRVRANSPEPLPHMLKAGDQLKCSLCFKPGGNFDSLFAELEILFECEIAFNIPILGSVLAPSIATRDLHFGNVLVGDTKCDSVFVANDGNMAVRLDSLAFPPEIAQFDIDTAGLFPTKLNPGDTLWIKVCFMPDERDMFATEASAANDYDIKNQIIIDGRGVAPEIKSIIIDWRKRRVGSRNDTTFILHNTGDAPTKIRFDRFERGANYDAINPEYFEGAEFDLLPTKAVDLSAYFNPSQPIAYDLKAIFEVDWQLHDEVTAQFLGEGIIPEVETYDLRFAPTVIFTSRDTIADILRSGGSADLSATLTDISGDVESFSLDTSVVKIGFFNMDPDSTISLPIEFSPQNVGEHKITLTYESNAATLGDTAVSYVNISGLGVPADTTEFGYFFNAGDVYACKTSSSDFEIENTGNIPIYVDKLTIWSDRFEARWSSTPDFPVEIKPDNNKSFQYEILATKNQAGSAIIEGTIRSKDSVGVLREEILVEPLLNAFTVNPPGELETTPGENLVLSLDGVFDLDIDLPVMLSMTLKINNFDFDLLENRGKIRFYMGNMDFDVKTTMTQSIDSIEIIFDEEIVFPKGETHWETEIPLLTFLNDNRRPQLELTVFSENCLEDVTIPFEIKINGVCNFNLRPVKIISNFITMKISPNPAAEFMKAKIFLPEKDRINLEISDVYGKKYLIKNNMLLDKGTHLLNLNLNGLSDGVYSLNLTTRNSIIKNMFVIIK